MNIYDDLSKIPKMLCLLLMKGIITRNPKSDPDHVIRVRHHAMWSTNKNILVAE